MEILKNRTAVSTPIAEPTVTDKISAIHKSQIENHGAEVIKDPYLFDLMHRGSEISELFIIYIIVSEIS